MGKKRRATTVAAVVVAIAVAGFGVYRWQAGSGTATPTVQYGTAAKANVAPVLTVTGAIAADERTVGGSASGKVAEIFVQEGQAVTTGQNLLRLDATSAQQDVDIAASTLASARAQRQDLIDKSASSAQIASQNATVARAVADYQKAVAARDGLLLTSPIDGTVINVAVNVGDQAGGSSAGSSSQSSSSSSSGSTSGSAATSASSGGLVTVADVAKLYVKAGIDQADISKIATGQAVKVTLDALPGKAFTGLVAAVDPVPETNQNVVTYSAKISLDKLDPGIRLGMSANLEIDLGKKANVLVVPNAAVNSTGAQKTVTKVVDGQPTAVPVEVGASDSQNTEITSGLSAGDRIVTQSYAATGGQSGSGSSVFGGGSGGQRGVGIPGLGGR